MAGLFKGWRLKMGRVILKKGAGRQLKGGGAWVYDNEIASYDGDIEDGGLVEVQDFDGYCLGTGFINRKSKITVRMMTRKKNVQVDEAFIRQRVREAVDYRLKTLKEDDRDAFRVIFGEADWLPGIVVDKFADVLVVQSLALGIDRFKLVIVDSLKDVFAEHGMPVRGVYERSDAKVRQLEGMERVKGFIGASFDTHVHIVENGVKYIVDVEDGQKTGFFLDQKYNRAAIRQMCGGARVLDCFTHTGSFALNAGMAGASEVLGVDASELAVGQATENARLNGLSDRVRFECHDVFELLPQLEKAGEKYDVVILDPPAFTKSRESVKKAVKGYREINLRGMKLVKDGGFLATCSCSHFMEPELFAKTIAEAARDVHKRLRQVEYRTQCCDHPILWAADESLYLKFYIFQVCDER
jgi:23S rRNA (cytosine1962-C5)-methyltransferase